MRQRMRPNGGRRTVFGIQAAGRCGINTEYAGKGRWAHADISAKSENTATRETLYLRPFALILSSLVLFVSAKLTSADVISITRGGTYTGTFEANGLGQPAIRIDTADPVILKDCTVTGRGPFIVVDTEHANLTVIGVHATGRLPAAVGDDVGRFLTAQNPDSLEIAECDLNHTEGIYVLGFGTPLSGKPTISIHDNRVQDIDGRVRGSAGVFKRQAKLVQFVQLDKVRHVSGIEIAWNQVINDPGESAVEDNISIYKSSGVPDLPIRIHDNYIRGAYPVDPAAAGYSGGGIMLGDGAEANPDDGPAYVEAFDNQVLDTTNYGIAISAGHDITFHDNRIISSGLLPGRVMPRSQNVGAYIWDANKKELPRANFHDNGGRGNVVGWNRGIGRNDWWMPDATFWESNVRKSGPISPQTVIDEWKRWEGKLAGHRLAMQP